MGTIYDWAGSEILLYPLTSGKRTLCPPFGGDTVSMDKRDFIVPPNRVAIGKAFNAAGLSEPPTEKEETRFDERARMCWQVMISSTNPAVIDARHERIFSYFSDPRRHNGLPIDFWQLPAETLARKKGDCEDLAILLASLMIGTGISPYCVRTVIGGFNRSGTLDETEEILSGVDPASDSSEGAPELALDASNVLIPDQGMPDHAWVVYKAENGFWYLIDPTWGPHMYADSIANWYRADNCDDGILDRRPGNLRYHYVPDRGFNNEHAWRIGPVPR